MSATDPARVAVVIPALNEERAIRDIVESVLSICPNVIVIDDGSTDATVERIADLPVTLIRHATSLGKGQGLRDGFRKARELGFDAVVAMDGDGQHLAVDIPRLLAAAQRYPEHIVIGARVRHRENQPPARRRANAVADWGISWACATAVVDTQSGQRYYPLGALELVDIASDDFVFEAALLIAAAREKHLGIVSVPIESRYQEEFRSSHFRPVRDVTRITLYTVGRILHYGHIVRSYRRANSTPALIHDPPAEC
jgi:glycosyltransferase involved in cell wall biosynthesis